MINNTHTSTTSTGLTRSRNTVSMRVRDVVNRAESTFSGQTLDQIDSRYELFNYPRLSRA